MFTIHTCFLWFVHACRDLGYYRCKSCVSAFFNFSYSFIPQSRNSSAKYMEVQLDLTPEIEVAYMLFKMSH